MLRNKKTGELREPPDSIRWTRWQESGDWEQVKESDLKAEPAPAPAPANPIEPTVQDEPPETKEEEESKEPELKKRLTRGR